MANTVTITINKLAVMAKIEAASKKGVAAVSNELLKDANELCPSQDGELARSSIRESDPDNGELVWDTPYARYQYYGMVMAGKRPKKVTKTPLVYKKDGNPSHPKATSLWAEKAVKQNRDKYRQIYQQTIDKEV
jgi:hypothetical protein